MQQFSNYNTYFYEIAYENYLVMKGICETLDKEGYYKEPEKLLKHTIYDSLDLYIQSVLVEYCVFCNYMDETSKQFIKRLVEKEMLPLTDEKGFDEESLTMAKKVVSAPPILLQLCGLYDYEKKKELSSVFFDRMMSILLALASLDGEKSKQALIFIEKFYEQTCNFINVDQRKSNFPRRYLFKKMVNESIVNYEDMSILTINDSSICEKKQETTNVTKNDKIIESSAKEIETEEVVEEESRIDQLLEELNSLIGLKTVKEQINSLINVIKVRKLRMQYDMPISTMSYHMVFTGNPGTGKTTVARLMAEIYKELGILKKGTFIETDRSGLVAGYVGQTAIKVKDVVKSALGGVLFIDEAYSLATPSNSNDFGSEAIDTLVKMMEDHRDDLVVIVAGYKEEMQTFLKSNTGLISRFNTFIEFEDYSVEELEEILVSLATASKLHLTKEAKEKVRSFLCEHKVTQNKEFGNARGIRNLFEKILVNQANRLVTYDSPTKEQVSTIEADDIYCL